MRRRRSRARYLSTPRPAVLKLKCTLAVQSQWVTVAEGWAALYFEQSSLGASASDPANHNVRKWVLGEESASQAHNRFSINI